MGNGSSIIPGSMSFTSPENIISLSNSVTQHLYSDSIVITISETDLNELKRSSNICIDTSSCLLSLTEGTVSDMNGNNIGNVVEFGVDKYTPDTTRPQLKAVDVNLDLKVITLRFSETMRASTLVPSTITIRSNGSANALELSLSDESIVRSGDNVTLIIEISGNDVDRLHLASIVLPSQTSIYVTVDNSTVADMNTNTVVQTTIESGKLTMDKTPPTLMEFDLNMNTGLLSLSFSEAMSIESLQRHFFTLLSENTGNETYKFDLFPSSD